MQPCNRIYYSKNLLKVKHVSSGIRLIIRSSNRPLSKLGGNLPVPTQPGQRPVTTCVYKPEAADTVGAPDDEEHAARNMFILQ
jgi:hypothetical protein